VASFFRRLRIGFGNLADSFGPEKAWDEGIAFKDGSNIGYIDFNGSGWDLEVNGVSVGWGTSNIADNAITNAKLRDSAALSVIGRNVNSAGDPADIAATVNGTVLKRSSAFGGLLQFGAVELDNSSAVSGTLPVANGGTGRSTLTANTYVQGNGTGLVNLRTFANVWSDISPTALATVQTWTAAQTWTGISYHNGGMRVKTTDRTAGGTMTTSDYYVLVSGTSGITLPAAPGDGQTLVLLERSGFNCTVSRNGNLINGAAANHTLPAHESVRFVFRTGSGWFTFAG